MEKAKSCPYTYISKPDTLKSLNLDLQARGVSISMDFEEESNLHCYGEHLCTIQVYDGTDYYFIDALALSRSESGRNELKDFLESPVEKLMFACQSDSSIARKTLGIQLAAICDVRLYALALGMTGTLSAVIEQALGICIEDEATKKRFQRTNWMRRPLSEDQIQYALSDVRYLFDLREKLLNEVSIKLKHAEIKQLEYDMRHCAEQKNPDRPGWEKICNWRMMSSRDRVYVKHFFLARDSLARKANVPASNILAKQLIVAMAKQGTWQGILAGPTLRYRDIFEQARLKAQSELCKNSL